MIKYPFVHNCIDKVDSSICSRRQKWIVVLIDETIVIELSDLEFAIPDPTFAVIYYTGMGHLNIKIKLQIFTSQWNDMNCNFNHQRISLICNVQKYFEDRYIPFKQNKKFYCMKIACHTHVMAMGVSMCGKMHMKNK